MANSNGWGDGAANNSIGWGQGANNNIGWGDSHAKSWAGATDIVGIDSDAQAFITAAAITDPVQINAINTLVEGMKTDGIWTKMKAVYPFVGGTASAHKWNLKDPRDLDAAFRLVFNGGWTHSSNGATPNGTNGYADTKLNPFSVFGAGYGSHGSYYRETFSLGQTNIDGCTVSSRFDMGYDTGVLAPFMAIGSNASNTSADTDNKGLVLSTRQGATSIKLFRNNVLKVNGNQTFVSNPNLNYYIAGRNFAGTAQLFSNSKSIAFKFIADSLNDTDVSNLTSKVQAFQTSLSRQV